jgi:hypothetical protein
MAALPERVRGCRDARRIDLRVARAGSASHPFIVGLDEGFLIAWPESSGPLSHIRIRHVP